ncbi:MAG: hypothetical protein ACTSYD_11300 [Candidatus Heimdallarchaeaceae archaeon]
MTDVKFFNFGEFFTKRALISTIIGVILVVVTEFLLPWLNILQVQDLWQYITPATITFTITILLIASVIAKNIAASLLLASAASLSFYSPYETFSTGYLTIAVVYFVYAFFSGFFAAKPMSGKAALLTIGLVFGIQGILASTLSALASLDGVYETFQQQGIGIAHGSNGTIPLFDIIFGAISLLYMIVFIILATRSFSTSYSSRIREIIGHIIIFLAIVGLLVIQIIGHDTLTQTQALQITSSSNLEYLNAIFAKTLAGEFSVNTLLNAFYSLAIAGMVIGIGLAFIVYQRANGTLDIISFDLEGAFLIISLPLAIILGMYAKPWQDLIGATFYLNFESWYIVATEFTNLVLINLLLAYLILRIVALIKRKLTE